MRLRTTLQLLLVIGLALHYSDACGAKGKKGKKPDDNPKPDNNSKPPPDKPAPDKPNSLGGVKQEPYDNSGYDGKNGQAGSPDDLKCDFEGPCCWKNTKPPYDTLEWNKISGTIDPAILKSAFGTETAPSGNALAVATDKANGATDKAEFESCVIPCAGDSITVTFKHWVTSGVKLQVCEIAKADPATLLNCQDVPAASPGPDTVTLAPGSDLILTIVASNLVGEVNAAIIDEIVVAYQPCGGSSPPPAGSTGAPPPPGSSGAPPPGEDNRKNFCCNFEAGPCPTYKTGAASGGAGNDFVKAGPERFKNPATGVPPSPDKAFAAVYMKPKEKGIMSAEGGAMPDKTIIKFQEYKATQDVILKACCETEQGCTYDTGGKVDKTDFRQWYQGSIECPAGTTKVIFYAENTGVNEGGVGIDNVEVVDVNTQKSLC